MHAEIRVKDGSRTVSVDIIPIGSNMEIKFANSIPVTAADGATGNAAGWCFRWKYENSCHATVTGFSQK